MTHGTAPELQASDWLDTDHPITLESLRGRIVPVEAFRVPCPGCVSHAVPQAKRVRQTFSPDDGAETMSLRCERAGGTAST